jgi:hypothetical protein
MASLLDFVNRVRTIQDLDEIPYLLLDGTETDDGENCVLARALGVPIYPVDHGDRMEMHFRTAQMARRVGVVMYLEWRSDPPAVLLPHEVSDVAVADHLELVRGDEFGVLQSWLVPTGEPTAPWLELTPDDPHLLSEAPWQLRRG